jgi:asparagine synthase (glutamine-hydrolysing)
LRGLVDQAVRCRLPRSGEIGAHLSGGLDSSAISVLAARQVACIFVHRQETRRHFVRR